MSETAQKPTIESVRAFIAEALQSFTRDPADSDFQRGYLQALYVVGTEALGIDLGEPPAPKRPQLRVVE